MSTTEDRVDIVVIDKVSEVPAQKIIKLADAARSAHGALKDMRAMLDSINTTAVRRLQADMNAATGEAVKQGVAYERLQAAQARTATALARLEIAQNKSNEAAARGILQQQRAFTEMERTETATVRLATAREKLSQTVERGTRGAERDGDVMVKLFNSIEQARAKMNAAASQSSFNDFLGVGNSAKGSARASASVFKQAFLEQEEAAKAADELAKRTIALKSAIDPAFAAQQMFNRAEAEASALMKAGAISQAEYAKAVQMATVAMNAHARASGGMAQQTGLSRFQLLTIQYTINDVIASLASGISPMTILMQQGGQVTQAWGGLTNTLRALGAAIMTPIGLITTFFAILGGGIALQDHANASIRELDRNLKLTGQSAGLTAGQFMQMADGIADATKKSYGTVSEVLIGYAKTGQMQGEQLRELTQATVNFAALSGQSNETVQKSWEKMIEQPGKFTREFMQQYGVFSSTEYAHIQLLEDTGQKTEAMMAVTQRLYDYYGKQAPAQLGIASSAWRTLSVEIGNAWEATKRFFASPEALPVQQQIEKATAALQVLEAKLTQGNGGGNVGKDRLNEMITAARTRLTILQETARLDSTAANAAAQRVQSEKDGADAVLYYNSIKAKQLDSQIKLNNAVAAYDKNMQDAATAGTQILDATGKLAKLSDVMQQNRAKAIAGFRKEFMPEATRDAKKAALEEERLDLAIEKVYGKLYKETDAMGMLSVEREKANKLAEIEIGLAGKKFALNSQQREEIIAMIDDIENQKRQQQSLDAVYEAANGPLQKYTTTRAAIRALLNAESISQAEATRQLNMATEAYKNASDPLYALNKQLAQEYALTGKLGDEREIAGKMQQIENELLAKGVDLRSADNKTLADSIELTVRRNLEATKYQTALEAQYNKSVGAARNLEVQQRALNQAYQNGWIGVGLYATGLMDIQAQMAQLKIDMGQGTWADMLLVTVQKNFSQIEESLTNLVQHGKAGWKSLIDSMLHELIRLAIVKPFMGALGGMFSQMLGSVLGGSSIAGSIGSSLLGNAASSAAGSYLGAGTVAGQFLTGSMSGANAIGTVGANLSGGGLDALLLSNGAYGTAAATAATTGITTTAAGTTFGIVDTAAFGGLAGAGSGLAGIGAGGAAAAEGIGMTAAAAIPVIGWAIAAIAIIASMSKSGEMRAGGQYGYSFDGLSAANPRRGTSVDANAIGATFLEGPSGGDPNKAAASTAVNTTVNTINSIFAGVGSDVAVTAFQAGYEGSKEGRGGVFTGGTLTGGATFGESGKGDNYSGTLFEKSSPQTLSAQDAFANFITDQKQSVIQALQAVAATAVGVLPKTITDIVAGVDAEALSDADAQAMVEKITGIIDAVKGFRAEVETLPFENLKNLSFDTAAGLLAAAGGLANFNTNLNTYYENFTSAEEKRNQVIANITKSLDDAGATFTTTDIGSMTRAMFRTFVDGIDVSTEAGQKLYATAIAVSGAVASITPALDDLTTASTSLKDAVSDAFDTLKRSIDAQKKALKTQLDIQLEAYDTQIKALQGVMQATDALKNLLESTLSQLNTDEVSGLTRDAAAAQISAALASAKSGTLPTADSLKDALSVITRPSADLFSSFVEYQRDFDSQAAKIAELDKLTGVQKTVEQQQLDALNEAKDVAQAAYDAEVKRLDDIVAEAQHQVNAINGVNDSVLTVTAAVDAFNAAMQALLGPKAPDPIPGGSTGGAGGGGSDPGSAAVNALHAQVAADAQYGGNAYSLNPWNSADAKRQAFTDMSNLLASEGETYTPDQLSIMASGHTLTYWDNVQKLYDAGLHPTTDTVIPEDTLLPAFAAGGYHKGGSAIVGENGPELITTAGPAQVFNAQDTASMLGGSDSYGMNVDMSSVCNAINDFAYESRTYNREILSTLKNIYDLFDSWNANGMPAVDPTWTAA